MGKITDKIVVITGGASGIGKAVAAELGAAGNTLVLADVQQQVLDETVAEFERAGYQVEGKIVDVRDPVAVQALVDGTVQAHGRIDYMFNNAGINIGGELRDTSLDDWNRLIDVNLRGVIHGVHAAYGVMRTQGFGHIVNTASLAGITPAFMEGAYGATKHAVVGLSLVLRGEAEEFGVQCSVICPGVIQTPMVHNSELRNFRIEDALEVLPMKPMPVEKAAKVIVRGVRNNDAVIVVTGAAHALWRVYRAAPEAFLAIGRPLIKKMRAVRIP